MKAIQLASSIDQTWISGVSDEALPSILIELTLQSDTSTQLILFENPRTLSHSLSELESLLALPYPQTKGIEIGEFPNLTDYQQLDTIYLDKQCDVVRTLSLIQKCKELNKKVLIFTTPDALLQELPDTSQIRNNSIQIDIGSEFSFEALRKQLAEELGYSYEAVCETPGQFAVRGGIIDIYPTNELNPFRIDFFGDEVDSIKSFDPTTQLTEKTADSINILPAQINLPESKSKPCTLMDYLDHPCTWLLRNTHAIEINNPKSFTSPERISSVNNRKLDLAWNKRSAKNDHWYSLDDLAEKSKFFNRFEPDQEVKSIPLQQLSKSWIITEKDEEDETFLQQNEVHMLGKLADMQKKGYHVVIGVSKIDEKERIKNLISSTLPTTFKPDLHVSPLPQGIVFEANPQTLHPGWLMGKHVKGLVLVSEADLHPYLRIRLGRKRQRRTPEISQVDAMLDFTELAEGDALVHQQHGICIFRGIQTLDFSSNKEALSLEFANDSMLYVPLNESHLLTRYIGLTKRSPKLGKIGSNQWDKDRKAAEKATMDLAAELLSLQAKRESIEGFSFPPDDDWMKQFEKAFPYNETPDQLTSIHQCKADMERSRPMDRLICGDVGFGKTEVAMRAAFKALEAGKQVCLLVPTTVLCQQHYHTFQERMAPFPVSVEMLSGFRSPAQQKQIIQKVKTGQVDMIIGTHRLLGKDVQFHDLGLIIIDEEHRFGVKQKEKLKKIAETVDALTLSATPIPRTLYMALTGARDLSVIETPPRNRLPIETVVRSYSNEIVDSAIRAEVDRGGQVFYLHNRVSSIEKVADAIRQRSPKLRVVVGHGQMDRHELEEIMTQFVDGNFDVMVCTTIIESGLDIPNCNTLIIEGADKFGLAQLYQIRGRVGRFNRQAYAYLLLHKKTIVADVARKRLTAIRQYNELGAGYRIAMRDLELRGAGNILGSAQSGHIAGVGFELYCRLLKQSITRFQTGNANPIVRATVNLDFARMGEPSASPRAITSNREKTNFEILKDSEEDEIWVQPIYAYIPQAYIHETKLRIDFYRKLASTADLKEVKEIRANMKDRFGKIPNETEALIRISAIRCLAEQKNIASVEANRGRLKLRIANTRKNQYVKNGTYFPRLTKKTPLLLLNDCLNFVSKL